MKPVNTGNSSLNFSKNSCFWLYFAPSGLVIPFTRGFTPVYVLSALRACCRAKRFFALYEKKRLQPEKIILFGSAAWSGKEVHDIDLFIVKQDVPYYGEDKIRELYRLLDTDAPIDYLVYRPEEVAERLALGDPFVEKVFRKGKVLYG